MKRIFSLVIAVMAVLSAVSCGNKSKLNGYWKFDTVNGEKVVTVEKPAFLAFENGRVHGCLGVNLVHGYYEVEFSEIDMDDLGMTMMMGLPEDAVVESKIQAALKAVETYKIKGDTLTLYGDNRLVLLTLVKSAEPITVI